MSNIVLQGAANGGAVVLNRPGEMVMSPAEAKRRYEETQAFIAAVLVRGVDYGQIPGTEKQTLLKPGAERLCELYGYEPRYEFVERTEDWGLGGAGAFLYYIVRCTLVHRATGTHVAQGMGSCNSRESKYAYRWEWEEKLPAGVDPKTLKMRRTKKGDRQQYALPNDAIPDLANTILKMACKRALVSAVQLGCRVGGVFEVDLDEVDTEELVGEVEAERSWERGAEDQVRVLGDKLRAAAKEGLDALKREAANQGKVKLSAEERKAVAAVYKELEAELKKAPAKPAPKGEAKGEAPTAPGSGPKAAAADHDPETGEVREPGAEG